MTTQELGTIAENLRKAEESRVPIAPITTTHPQISEEDAYEIQWINAANHLRSGHRVVGYKIGLTSREAQKHFQVFKPDYGHLFDTMAISDGAVIKLADLIQPKIEGEIAFVLGSDVKGPGITPAQILRCVDYVSGALEIVDSRIAHWGIRAHDTIADNGSSSRFVLSPKRVSLRGLDLSTIGMNLSRNGEGMVTAAGAAVMGNPLNAVVLLANELGARNIGLRAGQVILSGSLGGMITVTQNDYYTAEFLTLGRVDVAFH